MPSFKRDVYRAVVNPDQLGFGAGPGNRLLLGSISARIRRTEVQHPFAIANEMISAEIGRFLRLPIPPFSIVQTQIVSSPVMFATLDFNYEQDPLPPIDAQVCVAALPRICTGVLLFDILIANHDRHDENIVVDSNRRPKRMRIFDHELALFGGFEDEAKGIDRLDKLWNRLGITGGPTTRGNEHCILTVIDTPQYFDEWIGRIVDIPDWFLKEICESTVGLGVDQKQAKAAREFLVYRKKNLRTIIDGHRSAFAAIQEWKLPGELF